MITRVLCRSSARALIPVVLLSVTVGSLVSCRTTVPDVSAEAAVARALGIDGAVTFRGIGSPVDEPGDEGTSLSLTEAVGRAVACDPGLQASLARVRVALAEADQARLLPNPVLDLAIRFPSSGSQSIIDVNVSQSLLSLLTRRGRTSAADARLRAAASDSVTAALDLVQEVSEIYSQAQTLDAIAPVLVERQRLLGRLLDLAQSRLDAGEGTSGDLLALQSRQVELSVEITDLTLAGEDARLRLTRIVGSPHGDAAWQLDSWAMPSLPVGDERDWINIALARRPEIEAQRWILLGLGEEVALARWAAFDGTDVGLASERDGDWSVGPAITGPLPLFDQGQARSARAEALRVETWQELVKAQRMVIEDVRRAFRSLKGAQANLEKVVTELLPLLEERRAQSETLYEGGQESISVLLLAEQDLKAAQAKRVELEARVTLARARLERAVGGAGTASEQVHSKEVGS